MPPRPTAGRYPLFEERDGVFLPLSLAPPPGALAVQDQLRRLPLPQAVSVYLRGSRLEELHPHPDADLDLVVLTGDLDARRRSWEVLEPWSRAAPLKVDLMACWPRELETCAAIRLLLATRSFHLAGPAVSFAPVPANFQSMQAHARRYHPWRISDALAERPARRLCELKLLTRAFGVWSRVEGGPFSRDIGTCLGFADQLAADAAGILRAAWSVFPSCPPLDVSTVKRALQTQTVLTREGAWTAHGMLTTVRGSRQGREPWGTR